MSAPLAAGKEVRTPYVLVPLQCLLTGTDQLAATAASRFRPAKLAKLLVGVLCTLMKHHATARATTEVPAWNACSLTLYQTQAATLAKVLVLCYQPAAFVLGCSMFLTPVEDMMLRPPLPNSRLGSQLWCARCLESVVTWLH